jgi:hypothetical protein
VCITSSPCRPFTTSPRIGRGQPPQGALRAKAANYTVVQDGAITLKDPVTNDIDHTYPTFSAQGLATTPATADRPILHFMVNPQADNARLELTLNDKIVYAETFSSGPARAVREVLTQGELLAAGNTLNVANRGTGSFDISDVAVESRSNV